MREVSNFGVHSGMSKERKAPFVCLHFKDVPPFQVGTDDALNIAGMIVDASMGAIAASYFMKFLTEQMGVPEVIADVAVDGFIEFFEQQMPSAQGVNHDITVQLEGYSDYLYDLLIKKGEAPLDINEWVEKQPEEGV